MRAEPGHRGVGEFRVRAGHGDDDGLARDDLGAIAGMDVGIQQRGGVLEQPLGLEVVLGPVIASVPIRRRRRPGARIQRRVPAGRRRDCQRARGRR